MPEAETGKDAYLPFLASPVRYKMTASASCNSAPGKTPRRSWL